MRFISSIISCFFLIVLPTPSSATSPADTLAVSLSFVREMEYIPEVDDWSPCTTGINLPLDSLTRKATLGWKKIIPILKKEITPKRARQLSLWGRPQMIRYKKVGSLDTLTLLPKNVHPTRNLLLFEATVDTLPSHSRIVTRWLKLYLVYDQVTESIARVTVTVRGYLFE